jgi:hypothetical protein
MSVTGVSLVLAGVGAIAFFGRRRFLKKREQAKRDGARRVALAQQAEADRLACLDLGKSLMASAPGREEPVEAGSGRSKRSG